MIYQPWKEGFYLTSVGIDMSLYLVLTSRTEVNGVALYFKILLAGYLTASNEGSFTDEKLLFSAWFTLFLCMNIHSFFFFFKNRYEQSNFQLQLSIWSHHLLYY